MITLKAPPKTTCVWLSPRTFRRLTGQLFMFQRPGSTDTVLLPKEADPCCMDGIGYIVVDGEYIGAYDVMGEEPARVEYAKPKELNV